MERPGSDRPLHQLIPIEVKYRYDVSRFLKVEVAEFFQQAGGWPGLCLILVTENPDAGRSCFQVVVDGNTERPNTADLHTVTSLDIYGSTVLEYEGLGRNLFKLIEKQRSALGKIAKP